MSARAEIKLMMETATAAGKTLTAPEVVAAAKDAAQWPALNQHLWQVAEADLAAEARLARAHRLLIAIVVTTGDGVTTRANLHVDGAPGYVALSTVLSTPNLAMSKLQELTADINRARGRLRAFRAALPDDLADEIDAALQQAEDRATAATKERAPAETAA